MKAGWSHKRLRDLSSINYGYTEKAASEAIGPKFLRITDIQNESVDWSMVPYCKIDEGDFSSQRLRDGDIVFARTGATTGKSYLVSNPPDAVCASYLIRLRLRSSDMLPKFVSYYFNTKTYWDVVSKGISGSAQGGFNASKLAELEIPTPSISEQQRVVSILDEVFEKLASATANMEKNLKSARELFDSYLNSVFIRKDAAWTERKLGDVCRLINGRAYSKKELLTDGHYPVLRVGNFFTNRNWYYSDLELDKDKYCDAGDLLYAWSASFGPKIWDGGKVIFHYHIWKVEPDFSAIGKMFLFYFFEWDKERIKQQQGAGTTMIHVSKESMEHRSIVLPELNEQNKIVTNLDKLSSETKLLEEQYQQKIVVLAKLKQSILQKAFSGELTAPPSNAIKEAAE